MVLHKTYGEPLVFTGMGAVTPLGNCVDEYWRNLIEGRSGIGCISRFDSSLLPVHLAAEVRNFDPAAVLPHPIIKASALFMQFALVAAMEALKQSNLPVSSHTDRIGIVFATAMGGVSSDSETGQQYFQSKSKKVSPHFVPATISNMAAAHAAIHFGITGPSVTVHTACSAGGDAIMTAALFLRANLCDAVLILGGESCICDIVISGLAQAKALSRANDNPQTSSRPFDASRDGFVIGEGGGALLLEKASFARERNAEIFAELAGFANTMDAHHITAPHPEGVGAARCMRNALLSAHLEPCDIGYINAHGTATVLGDIAETRAVRQVFDSPPPVSSTKGATGHLMGAGGITEVIACILAMRYGILPPTINYSSPDPECDLDCIPNHARELRVDYAMSNAMGFGGQNSSIIVKRCN